jgi:uridine phosphorylase
VEAVEAEAVLVLTLLEVLAVEEVVVLLVLVLQEQQTQVVVEAEEDTLANLLEVTEGRVLSLFVT